MESSVFLKKAVPAIKEGKSAEEIAKLVGMPNGKKVSAELTKLRKFLKPHGFDVPKLQQGRRTDPKEAEALLKVAKDLLSKAE